MAVIYAEHRFRERRVLSDNRSDLLLVHGSIFGECLMTPQAWSLYRSISNNLGLITLSSIARGTAKEYLPEIIVITTAEVKKNWNQIN